MREKGTRFVLPKQTWFVFFYMAVLYLVYIAAIHYARTHPIVDEPPQQETLPQQGD
jgi:hypothetical protein